jgi:hypothetical protein
MLNFKFKIKSSKLTTKVERAESSRRRAGRLKAQGWKDLGAKHTHNIQITTQNPQSTQLNQPINQSTK